MTRIQDNNIHSEVEDFYQGDTKFFKLTLKDDDNQLIDLTNSVIFIKFSRKDLSGDPLYIRFTPPTSSPEAIEFTENGVVIMRLSSSITKELTPGRYWLDFQISFDEGLSERVIRSFRTDLTVGDDLFGLPAGVS